MTSDATPVPGNLTVPPLFGWQGIVVLLVAAIVIGVGYLLLSALSASRRPSDDWDALLQGRSRNRHEDAAEPSGPQASPSSTGPAREPFGASRFR